MLWKSIKFCPCRSFWYSTILVFNLYINLSLEEYSNKADTKQIELIKKYTDISTRHLTPEIKLRIIPLSLREDSLVPFRKPYWMLYWPGGQALSRYILDNSSAVKNLSVLDVGCGCGAASIAAAKSNAREVVANDIDPVALTASELNAELNSVHLKYNGKDLIGSKISHDCVLVGDMFIDDYDIEFCNRLFDWLYKIAREGKTVLLGDADRSWLCRKRWNLKPLATYELPHFRRISEASVYTIVV